MGWLSLGIWDWQSKFVAVLFVWGSLSCAAAVEPPNVFVRDNLCVCPVMPLVNSMLRFRDTAKCPLLDASPSVSPDYNGIIEGDEIVLQKALNMVHRNSHEYVVLLFYATWCPFSLTFRPRFSVLASLYPSIPHFAIEESAVRPSLLSKYGVHGFPTLFIVNSTMRIRYHGSRSISSLGAFYGDVAGIKAISLGQLSVDNFRHLPSRENVGDVEQQSCPFSWARSPENLFRQETYLTLATAYVLLRLLYFFCPILLLYANYAWTRFSRTVRFSSLLEHPLSSLKRTMQSFNSLKKPCKKSNLQEGAMNARAWASNPLLLSQSVMQVQAEG